MQAHESTKNISLLSNDAIALLKDLIAIPSFSKEEKMTADLISNYFLSKEISVQRKGNNIWVKNKYFDSTKPTILLNSHHDTVKPNAGFTLDPFTPTVKDGKLFGLGSNDAGASLVSLLATFLYYYHDENLANNFIYAATAEEEISGANGIESILSELGDIDFAIVGEPTQMHLAIAEKGLLVLDCISKGHAGHAARDEGDNAIYNAMKDIEWFRSFQFPKISETLGKVKMNVTQIQSGTQHNMIPDECKFTADIRVTDAYTHEEIISVIKQNVSCEVTPRSLRLKPSSIDVKHPFIVAGRHSGRNIFGSPTTSDQALMPFTSVKIGPGDSSRSHTADEFIFINEIEEGIKIYIQLLDQMIKK
jgi:acetylornithine deacetylase